MKVIGVRREGVFPERRISLALGSSLSAAGSTTESRPHTTSPERQRSSSHSGLYDSTRSAKSRSQSPAGHSNPWSCSITSASPALPCRRLEGDRKGGRGQTRGGRQVVDGDRPRDVQVTLNECRRRFLGRCRIERV